MSSSQCFQVRIPIQSYVYTNNACRDCLEGEGLEFLMYEWTMVIGCMKEFWWGSVTGRCTNESIAGNPNWDFNFMGECVRCAVNGCQMTWRSLLFQRVVFCVSFSFAKPRREAGYQSHCCVETTALTGHLLTCSSGQVNSLFILSRQVIFVLIKPPCCLPEQY